MGHGREREVGGWEKGNKKRRNRNYHTLVVCYHAHWAIAYLACLPIWVLL